MFRRAMKRAMPETPMRLGAQGIQDHERGRLTAIELHARMVTRGTRSAAYAARRHRLRNCRGQTTIRCVASVRVYKGETLGRANSGRWLPPAMDEQSARKVKKLALGRSAAPAVSSARPASGRRLSRALVAAAPSAAPRRLHAAERVGRRRHGQASQRTEEAPSFFTFFAGMCSSIAGRSSAGCSPLARLAL